MLYDNFASVSIHVCDSVLLQNPFHNDTTGMYCTCKMESLVDGVLGVRIMELVGVML